MNGTHGGNVRLCIDEGCVLLLAIWGICNCCSIGIGMIKSHFPCVLLRGANLRVTALI